VGRRWLVLGMSLSSGNFKGQRKDLFIYLFILYCTDGT
jgi:hypothetical protein